MYQIVWWLDYRVVNEEWKVMKTED